MTKDEAIKLIKIELDGICETQGDYDDGWWETSIGAEFGKERLKNVLKIVEALGDKDEAIHKALKVLNCLINDRVYETSWVKEAIDACEEAVETEECP